MVTNWNAKRMEIHGFNVYYKSKQTIYKYYTLSVVNYKKSCHRICAKGGMA